MMIFVSGNRKVIVGFDVQSLAREAWIWTAADGIVSMNDRLAAQGETGLPQLAVARAVTRISGVPWRAVASDAGHLGAEAAEPLARVTHDRQR